MNIQDAAALREIPLFRLLDEGELTVLAERLERRRALRGQMIFRHGDDEQTMYVILTGRIELYLEEPSGEHLVLRTAEPGEIFGEMALLEHQPRSANARALDDVELITIDRDDLEALFQVHPGAAFDIMAMLSQRLRDQTVRLAEAVIRNPNEVAEALETASTLPERIADQLTAWASSIPFTYLNGILFAIWIIINVGLLPFVRPFDPYPFGFLTMSVSLEAIFLSLFVLISQNRQAARDKVRNDIEYEVNIRAEQEIRGLHRRIEELEQIMLEHLARLQAPAQRRGSEGG